MSAFSSAWRTRLLLTIAPALLGGVLYEAFLGHRHDYTGHYAAGYGATLAAMMLWLRVLPSKEFEIRSTWSVVPLCVACIGLGALTEATIFRIAKFDEVDFCNQSLGAVFAGAVALAFAGQQKLADREYEFALIAGIVFVGAGGCYAVA